MVFRCEMRFRAVVMRQEFEKLVSLQDPVKANQLLIEKEETLFKEMHWQPFKCMYNNILILDICDYLFVDTCI